MCNNNINNAGIITSSNIFAGTAAIGTPTYFGNNFAYFGHNTLPSSGSEYALLQEFNGTTFLNCSSGRLLRFRQNNIDIFTADAGGIYMNANLNMCNNSISNVGAFSRFMISSSLPQPVIQYGYVSTAAAFSGTVTITLPQRYTSVNSYIPFAVVQNDATTTFYVSTITRATFEIGWSGYTGFSDNIFSWNTLGT
jgi:hypothetical protein